MKTFGFEKLFARWRPEILGRVAIGSAEETIYADNGEGACGWSAAPNETGSGDTVRYRRHDGAIQSAFANIHEDADSIAVGSGVAGGVEVYGECSGRRGTAARGLQSDEIVIDAIA